MQIILLMVKGMLCCIRQINTKVELHLSRIYTSDLL